MIFDDVVRTYQGPADHGEPHWDILNRSTRPEMQQARERVETWFGQLCPAMQAGVRERLRSSDDQQLTAGFWELYLHELFTRLGYEIECASAVGNGRNIDFLLRRGPSAFYLEATIARKSVAERAADARRNPIYRALNRLQTDFTLGVTIESAGPADMRNVRTLRQRLQDWLAALDPDEAQRHWDRLGDGPMFRWDGASGWSLAFEAFPPRPEYRGQPAIRPLGMFMDETGGQIDDEGPLRRALNRKAPSRYGDLELPYVVAITEEPFSSHDEEWHRTNVLFGQEAFLYGGGQPTRYVRIPNGVWRGPGPAPRHRRLAAVLFTSDLAPWTIDRTELEWWDNPFANQPVPEDVVPDVVHRCQVRFDDDGAGNLSRVPAPRTPGAVLTE